MFTPQWCYLYFDTQLYPNDYSMIQDNCCFRKEAADYKHEDEELLQEVERPKSGTPKVTLDSSDMSAKAM